MKKEPFVPPVYSDALKALLGISCDCGCPFPSLCDAAMVGHDDAGHIKVVCVDPEKPCKWKPKRCGLRPPDELKKTQT